jgi:hypothetical protein
MSAAMGSAPREGLIPPARTLLPEAALVVVVHAAACALVLALGFDHVSDDDYARVTIAQAFAHAPRLDPSGTSWLPFPFWTLGASMLCLGRSLAVARVVSVALASVALALPYVALRATGSTRARAALTIALAALSPWSLWLGAATVPESFTASFTAAAVFALGGATRTTAAVTASATATEGEQARLPTWAAVAFALGMLAACLSRYEAWPVAAVLAGVLATQARRDRRAAALAAIVCAGPLLWLAWNAHAHGDALHFFARVARFKRALGEGSSDTLSALLLYPRLLLTMRPDVVLAVFFALASLGARGATAAPTRARWRVPLACVGAQLAFLAVGNARDGAPAHHAERALLGMVFILAAVAIDPLGAAWSAPTAWTRRLRPAAGAVLVAAWLATSAWTYREIPGTGAADDRAPQVARGIELRRGSAPGVVLTPCAFEHFALIAAYGAPERVEARPRSGAPITASCPLVEPR